MIDLRFVPLALKDFPGGAAKGGARTSSVFKSTYARTLDRLEHELALLNAIDVTIQAGYELGEIRNDGWPRSSSRPKHPAVVLSFRVRKTNEEYSFPCNTFTTFEHNLHAIAYTLESLRDVARYGVTRGREQYKGFAQIAAPPDSKRWTIEAAAEWLAMYAPGFSVDSKSDDYRSAYRAAARKLHPDRGVETPDWQRLQDAKTLLDRYFNLREGASA